LLLQSIDIRFLQIRAKI